MLYNGNNFFQGVTVTLVSKCERHCEHCLVKNYMSSYPDYELSIEQFTKFVLATYNSKYFFDFIDLSGGEPLHWPYLEEALILLRKYPIAKESVIFTNGLSITDSNLDSLYRIVKNLDRLEISTVNDNIYNIELAKKHFSELVTINIGNKEFFYTSPKSFHEDTLPAVCGVNAIGLVEDYVYICANCHNHMLTFPEYRESALSTKVCDFYLDKIDILNRLNKPHCAMCISNTRTAPYLDYIKNKINAW